MNKKLARGSGIGLIVGALLGVLVDQWFGSFGAAIVLGAAVGLLVGAGVASAR